MSFNFINNSQRVGNMYQEIYSNLNNGNPTDMQIINELPETTIEDVSKLDQEKKDCVICLENFKNKDKAIILPCIHLFHNDCIKSWLKKHNSCPICKFEISRNNLMRQNNNFQ